MSAHHETRPRVGARNPVPMRWAPKGRGEPVAQPATRGVHVTPVAGFVLGRDPTRRRSSGGAERGGGSKEERREARTRPPLRKMRGQEREGRPGRAPLGDEEAVGRCWHRGYPVVVGRVDGGGRTARCLGCGRSGPPRPSAAWALAALRDEARRSSREAG